MDTERVTATATIQVQFDVPTDKDPEAYVAAMLRDHVSPSNVTDVHWVDPEDADPLEDLPTHPVALWQIEDTLTEARQAAQAGNVDRCRKATTRALDYLTQHE